MQILKAIVDTQRTNTTIGYVNTGDVVKLNLQVISNGEIGDNWVNPVIELHGIKSDKKRVRQTDNIQIVDLANHHLEITLHEQFMTCDGLVRLQLVIKDDGGRISSNVFYLRVTKSLEMGVMESHDYIQVFDDFDTYMELVKEFEAKMKEDITLLEAEIQKASDLSQSISKNEAERQEAFEMNESNREVQFNQTQQTREDRFNQDQNTRETQFNASQSSQTSTFTTNEAERQKGETQRVTNENARQTAERNREVRMAELETKTSELIEKADEQVLKVDEFINTNTKRLLEEDARKDYMGNECHSIRETMNSNVDYAVKTAIGEFNYLDYEGQHITANHSIEGHVKSAILKGNTLVNLSDIYSKSTGGEWNYIYLKSATLVEGKKYFIKVLNIPTHANFGFGVSNYPVTKYFVNGVKTGQALFTFEQTSQMVVHINDGGLNSLTKEEVEKIKILIVEYQDGMENRDIPYFEGMQSVKMPVLTTVGKNLFDGKIEKSSIDVTTGSITPNVASSWSATNYINVKNINSLYFQTSQLSNMNVVYMCFDENKNFIGHKGFYNSLTGIITPLNNTHYIRLRLPSDIDVSTTQIEQGTQPTSYEPYKSNILSCNEEVVLGKVGDSEDTLDLLTGEMVERTYEYTFNGTESNITLHSDKTNKMTFRLPLTVNVKPNIDDGVICNKLKTITLDALLTDDDVVGVCTHNIEVTKNVYISIFKSELSTQDINGAKEWLSINTPTVRVVTNEEVIKTVDLSDNVVYSYDEVTHYDGSSESGSLVPTVAVKVPTNVNAVISSQRATIREQTEQINTLEKENTLLTEQNEKQDIDIALNQDAINFMLFEVMGLSNDDANKLNPMAIYFANQILKGKLTYTQVIGKYPQFKDDIDSCLLAEGRSDLIVKID